LEDYNDADIEKYRELLSRIQFEQEYNPNMNLGELIAFETQASTSLVMVGKRAYWDNLPKMLSEVTAEG
jgi:hypothetical protein